MSYRGTDVLPDIGQDEPSFYSEWPDHPSCRECKCQECVEKLAEHAEAEADAMREQEGLSNEEIATRGL